MSRSLPARTQWPWPTPPSPAPPWSPPIGEHTPSLHSLALSVLDHHDHHRRLRESARGGAEHERQEVRGLRPEAAKHWAAIGWAGAVVRRLCSEGGELRLEVRSAGTPRSSSPRITTRAPTGKVISNRDSQSNCWVNWKIMGQPCGFQVEGGEGGRPPPPLLPLEGPGRPCGTRIFLNTYTRRNQQNCVSANKQLKLVPAMIVSLQLRRQIRPDQITTDQTRPDQIRSRPRESSRA
jgi:hypothetical protein